MYADRAKVRTRVMKIKLNSEELEILKAAAALMGLQVSTAARVLAIRAMEADAKEFLDTQPLS